VHSVDSYSISLEIIARPTQIKTDPKQEQNRRHGEFTTARESMQATRMNVDLANPSVSHSVTGEDLFKKQCQRKLSAETGSALELVDLFVGQLLSSRYRRVHDCMSAA